jgi:hypothetical protein
MTQRCFAIFTRDFSDVLSGNVDSQYFVGSDSFFGHSNQTKTATY